MAIRDVSGGNGIVSAMGMPTMSGTWRNYRTGDTFTVRDCYFENNNLMVATMDGRMLDYNQLQEYVQCTKEEAQRPAPTKSTSNEIPREVQDLLEAPANPVDNGEGILPEDIVLLRGDKSQSQSFYDPELFERINRDTVKYPPISQSRKVEDDIIDRTLKDVDVEIQQCIRWNLPSDKIKALVNILNISPDDIADWYIRNLDWEKYNKESIINAIEEALK